MNHPSLLRVLGPWASLLVVAGCHRPPEVSPSTSAQAPPSTSAPALPAREPGPDECLAESAVAVIDHRVELAVSRDPVTIGGGGTIRFRSIKDTDLVILDARGLRVREVREVRGEGGPLGFRSEGGRLCVRLPAVLRAGREGAVEVAWEVPVDRATPHVGRDQVWAGYEASAWMPTLQDPAQRATLSLRLVLPAGWKATASGQPVAVAGGQPITEKLPGGREAHSFVLREPAPPFLFAFAAGRFDEASIVVGGVTLRTLGPPGADLPAALAVTAPMLSFFEERLGRSFPGAEYREVFVEGDAAQEAAGFSLLAATALGELRADPTEDWIFSHELAHQWFAWLIPCADFGDFWLNEGFATFLVAAFKEQRWGRPAYEREVGLWRKRSAKVHAEGHDAPLSLSAPGVAPRPVKEADLPPRGVTYARGALVLHRLRTELGDELFWRGLRRYVKDRAGQGARSEDLRAAFETATGRDLGPFFATWVYASAPGL